jgi:hypothetical protein
MYAFCSSSLIAITQLDGIPFRSIIQLNQAAQRRILLSQTLVLLLHFVSNAEPEGPGTLIFSY